MKTVTLIAIFITSILQITKAQTSIVTGSIKDEQGNPIPYGFIRDRPFKYASYADSAGNFKIITGPNSYLEVKNIGYDDQRIQVTNNTDYQMVLKRNSTIQDNAANSGGSNFKTNVATQHNTNDDNQSFSYGAGAIFAAPKKQEAHGSRYFFEDWVHGYFINPADSLAQNSAYLYNYDKIGGDLLITPNRSSAVAVDPAQFKSFTLFNNSGEGFTFQKIAAIDNNHYVQVLAAGSKYNIYKKIYTHFQKANYSTNGMSSSGNNYDEYIDEPTYYIIDVQTNAVQKLSLKKKALKDAFAKDADKLNKFMSEHANDDIDDTYLAGLGSYMNQ